MSTNYIPRNRKYKTSTNSNHKLPVAENILNQNFKVERPGALFVGDISYICTGKGWLYLATVKNICTKEIVGWATDDSIKTELCTRAVSNAVIRYKPPKGLIHPQIDVFSIAVTIVMLYLRKTI